MKTIIQDNQKGLYFKNGKFVRVLQPGKYHTFGDAKIEFHGGDNAIFSQYAPLESLLENRSFADAVFTEDCAEGEHILHFADGIFLGWFSGGRKAFWKDSRTHTFMHIPDEEVEIADNIPRSVFTKLGSLHYYRFDVAEYERGLLMVDGKFVRVLEPGAHYFWKSQTKRVEVEKIDTRLQKMELTGQEILTLDKVELRINFVCTYRVTDVVKIHTEVEDVREQMHLAAQLALREFVGRYKIDEILENKEELSRFVFERLKEKEAALFVCFADAGVKDIILPGEIRDIMNTVLVAEKRAQANVITRREEVASTRSLLNTAKLMDENRTLYKLKELEYLEKICENVGNITVDGRSNVMEQLAAILGGKKEA